MIKSLFEKRPFGRASVLASPDFQRFPEIFGLARTLALPGLGFQTGSNRPSQPLDRMMRSPVNTCLQSGNLHNAFE